MPASISSPMRRRRGSRPRVQTIFARRIVAPVAVIISFADSGCQRPDAYKQDPMRESLPLRVAALAAALRRLHGAAARTEPRRAGHPPHVHPYGRYPLALLSRTTSRRTDSTRARPHPKRGRLRRLGGIARVSTIVKCIRGIYTGPPCDALEPLIGPPAARSIHLDSGDIFEGAPVFNKFNGEVEMRAMSQIGLTAMALGNHEFDKGSVNLEAAVPEVRRRSRILAANYLFADPTDSDAAASCATSSSRSRSINVGGLKSASSAWATCRRSRASSRAATRSASARSTPTEAITQYGAASLRPQVDVLVVVSHLGLDEDEGVAAGAAESRRSERRRRHRRRRRHPRRPPAHRAQPAEGSAAHRPDDGHVTRPHRALPLGRVREVRRPPRPRRPRRRSTTSTGDKRAASWRSRTASSPSTTSIPSDPDDRRTCSSRISSR